MGNLACCLVSALLQFVSPISRIAAIVRLRRLADERVSYRADPRQGCADPDRGLHL